MSALGLIITADHEATINSFAAPPASFRAVGDVPDAWESPIPAWDQGQTSSCVGHAEAACFTHQNWVETAGQKRRVESELVKFSPWFCYLTAQRHGGFFGRDQGTSIASALKAATEDGACLESLCQRPERYDTVIAPIAAADAKNHRHLGALNVDLRNWDDMLAWVMDGRSVVIGTPWYSGQRSVGEVETLRHGRGGEFQGYHARSLIGWRKVGGVKLPVVLNSHSTAWGINGRAVIEDELWDWWRKDANFFALGFGPIMEREPERRDWSQFPWLVSAGSFV